MSGSFRAKSEQIHVGLRHNLPKVSPKAEWAKLECIATKQAELQTVLATINPAGFNRVQNSDIRCAWASPAGSIECSDAMAFHASQLFPIDPVSRYLAARLLPNTVTTPEFRSRASFLKTVADEIDNATQKSTGDASPANRR